MAKNNTTAEVKAQIKELKDNKANQLSEIQQKQREARAELQKIWVTIREAVAKMDTAAYGEAKKKKYEIETALEMYEERYNQIKRQEYISEANSDKVIDSLLEYEKTLEQDFVAAIRPHIKELAKLHKEYKNAVADTEATITTWTKEIHANYNSRGMTWRHDDKKGGLTDRSEAPIPVRNTPYTGCDEAATLGRYLDKVDPNLKG